MLADLRHALRVFAQTPGTTAVAILSLALGIGANTTVLCWIENLLLRPLPGVVRQEELVVLTSSQGEKMWDTLSLPDLRDAAALTDIFAGITGSQQTPACLTADGQSEWLYGQIVTANFFDMLGVRPLLGRGFRPDEDVKPGGHPVVVIAERLWRRRFAADPTAIGRTIELNRHTFTIVGVAPESFHGDITALSCDFWAPVMMHREVAYAGIDANQVLQRYARWHHCFARLQPGVTVEKANGALKTLSERLEKENPNTNRAVRLHARAPWNATYGAPRIFLPVLGLLLVVSLGVLLIVTANVANLLLARATTRRREMAIRLAIGAGRGRLVRQLLAESVLLAIAAGALGVLAAYWMVDLFAAFVPATPLPVELVVSIDGRVLAGTLALTLVAGVAFGIYPAWQASRTDLNETLKAGARGSGQGQHRTRSLLVVAEVALALVLLVSAGLCLQGLRRSRAVDPGFQPDGVLLAGLRVGMNGYTRDTAPAFYRTLQQRLAAHPQVEAVALANWFPLGFEDTGTANLEIPGRPVVTGEAINLRLAIVSPGYFDALRIPLVAGRDFRDSDDAKAPRVAVVNETFARRFWPDQEAVGRIFKGNGRDLTVVGVAKAGKYRALDDPPESFFYIPAGQATYALDLGLCVRTRGAPEAFVETLRQEVQAIDPGVTVWQALPMPAYIAAAVLPQRIAASLLVALSAVALALAAMGVYAVIAYAVGQRTREFGVRMALGADPAMVRGLVLRDGVKLAAGGGAIGLALSLVSARLLSGFLYGVSPFDPVTFVSVAAVLAVVATLACLVPAHRATRASPCEALRAE